MSRIVSTAGTVALVVDGAQPEKRRRPRHRRLTEPVIARVDGYALGGGFELALACDIMVASDRSVFALPDVRPGLVPGAGGAFRLARRLPLKTAMGYLPAG